MIRTIPLLIAACALAACGSGEDAGNNSSDSGGGDVPSASEQAQVPPGLQTDNSEQAVPVTLPSPTPIPAIPAAFQGRWGVVPEDCNPDRGTSDGLLVVSADRLSFGDTHAIVGPVRQVLPTRIEAMIDYPNRDAKGETWHRRTSLTVQGDGRTLVREETNPTSAATYFKCPGAN